jgi:hypothetical protein
LVGEFWTDWHESTGEQSNHVCAEVLSPCVPGEQRRERGSDNRYSQGGLPGDEAGVEDCMNFNSCECWGLHFKSQDQDKIMGTAMGLESMGFAMIQKGATDLDFQMEEPRPFIK